MRLDRFRLRTLLMLVLLAGVGIGGWILRRRSLAYSEMADTYARMEGAARTNASRSRDVTRHAHKNLVNAKSQYENMISLNKKGIVYRAMLKTSLVTSGELVSSCEQGEADAMAQEIRSTRMLELLLLRIDKYRRAARYPFLSLAPDPPLPE